MAEAQAMDTSEGRRRAAAALSDVAQGMAKIQSESGPETKRVKAAAEAAALAAAQGQKSPG
jgi:hypothetical protein